MADGRAKQGDKSTKGSGARGGVPAHDKDCGDRTARQEGSRPRGGSCPPSAPTHLNRNKAMAKEQKGRLTAWCLNLIVTYRIDFFRGLALSYTVNFLNSGDPDRIEIAIESCRVADNHGFEPDQKDYTELLRELRQIAKEVPLSDTAQSAITFVFGGEWGEAIEALDKLKRERDEQN